MGLDMYIQADADMPEHVETYEVWKARELAYWRKHPNLHGFIIREFAAGVDECQDIPLDAAAIERILVASEADALPETSGFFFGQSCPEDKENTREKLSRVLEWLKANPGKKIHYRASW
jgi:hypothetical protein